jgi:Dullard-like phosphatase family protein
MMNTVRHPHDLNRSRSCSFVPGSAIAFDLDDTLVLTTQVKPESGDFFTVRVRRRLAYVRIRPGLMEFLEHVRKLFDVFFFTASQPEYANQVIGKIAPTIPPCRRFCRDSCRYQSGYLVKDLRVLRRPLTRVLIVDDCPGSALTNPHHLIRVKPWTGDSKDDLLMSRLLPILQNIAHEDDLAQSANEMIPKYAYGDINLFPGLGAEYSQ